VLFEHGGCGPWLGNVSQQLQFDNGNPMKAAVQWCTDQDPTIAEETGVSETAGQLLPYCLAGIKAAGGP
jgi:hypothetical protein